MSAAALAEYLIMRPNGQQNVLHDCKFSRPPIVTANGDALRALRAYNADPRRSEETLVRVKEALTIKARDQTIKPKGREDALRCLEIIDLFSQRENALGMRRMALSEAPDFPAINIEGVTVSIQPDFLVGGGRGGARVGAGLLRVAKAPDPGACKRDETKARRGENRRDMARYLVAMMYMLLDQQDGGLGTIDRDLFFVADVRLGERIGPASDHSVRMRDIRGACQQIRELWPSIKAKPALYRK
ncbi:hypothetical protein [Bradyrhizobium sp. BWA-3-5]|uniref:hypothetical protein n=1 Tax=Bradyrhizobium sp. BWA-3-5 TaxID=3080013 RepID=UPI00293E278C|nr:hypothetical protein [Bradyrhizobium sp. BWA-3-5]WOH68653.1 hypothetical protein RX331_13490 [Bradyrhizobium sp. BWA-3-5]